jgi:hypothetical protein
MDVIDFLCVSLGSSTVQLHESLDSRHACTCSEAGVSSQNGDRAWRVHYRRAAFCCAYIYGQKDSMQKIFIKNYLLFTVGSVCRVKRFTAGWKKFRWWWRGWNGGAEVAETTVIRPLCCGFRYSGKVKGQVYQCWWRICRELNTFFPGSNVKCFTFYIHLWPTYWLSLVMFPINIIYRIQQWMPILLTHVPQYFVSRNCK